MKHLIPLFVLLATPLTAQVSVQVGPNPAPLGGPVFCSVTNDTDLIMTIGGCPWRIVDPSDGSVVFEPDCLIQEFLIGELGTINYRWDQVDQGGAPVAPGDYLFEVLTAAGPFSETVQVGGVDANLHLMGTPAIGTDWIGFGGRQVALSAPASPGATYWAAAALSDTPGTPTCAGVLPLANDGLFAASLGGGVLTNALGTLDADGFSQAPLLPLPDQVPLVGTDFALAFVVLDLQAACPIAEVSPALSLTVAPGAVSIP